MQGGSGSGGGAMGRGTGGGRGAGRGGGRGRKGGSRAGAGPSGNCVCPNCGHTIIHQQGKPCFEVNCPKCNTKMVRE